MSAPPLLDLRGLSRDYSSGLFGQGEPFRAVDRVSFAVEAGSIFGIVGESGSGKSTLARMVAALDRPSEGRVLLSGEDLFALPSRELRRRRSRFQMVFQDPYGSLDPRRRIGRSVADPLGLLDPRPRRAEAEARVAEILEAMGLRASDTRRFPHEFSGGQRQRIAIARALVTRPDLVIADEAVSALDLSVQAQVLNLVLDLRERYGVAFLFITHNLSVVDAICDRVGVMYRGRIVETGPVSEIFVAPRHPYTRLLLAAEPRLDAPQRRRPKADLPFAGDPADWVGCAFRARCPLASPQCRLAAPELRPPPGTAGDLPAPPWLVACHHAEGGLPAEPNAQFPAADNEQAVRP